MPHQVGLWLTRAGWVTQVVYGERGILGLIHGRFSSVCSSAAAKVRQTPPLLFLFTAVFVSARRYLRPYI